MNFPHIVRVKIYAQKFLTWGYDDYSSCVSGQVGQSHLADGLGVAKSLSN